VADVAGVPGARRMRVGHGGVQMTTPNGDLDLDGVRRDLESRRDATRERLAALATRPERGSALGFGKRIGDGTTEAVGRLTDIGIGGSLERVLERIERAVAKLDEGSYGMCDVCGDPIPSGRLRALPDAVLCLRCAESHRRAAPRRR
jgi:RNA polymerase-binding transcription factor